MAGVRSAIIGNGRMLASLDARGCPASLSFPNLDYAQHVGEVRYGIYYGVPGEGWLAWDDQEGWTATQHYVAGTNILVTHLFHEVTKVRLVRESYVLPSEDILVQRSRLVNDGEWILRGRFFLCAQLNVGEFEGKNTVVYDAVADAIVQWKREYWFAVGGDRPVTEYQCGKIGDPVDAKLDCQDGRLMGYANLFGHVNFALAWELADVPPGGDTALTVYVCGGRGQEQAIERLRYARKMGESEHQERTRAHWHGWLAEGRRAKVGSEMGALLERSELALDLMRDREHGSFIAGPLDYDYAYCWPRDASEVCLALLQCGRREAVAQFLEFCRRTQARDGSWFHRYWANGDKAPSWCALRKNDQYDQTASVVWIHHLYGLSLPAGERDGYWPRVWAIVKGAGEFLYEHIDEQSGLHLPCTDLWEERIGQFTYTAAAFFAGLKAACAVASAVGESQLGRRWDEQAERLRRAVRQLLYNADGYFSRGLGDPTPDAASLAVIDPFTLLDMSDPGDRDMALGTLREFMRRLGRSDPKHPGYGLVRYPDDRYRGHENRWIICTLWMARAALRVADGLIDSLELEQAWALLREARSCAEWCMAHATATGLLPEQVSGGDGEAAWVVPLGWSLSSYIYACHRLAAVEARLREASELGPLIRYRDRVSEEEYAVLALVHREGPSPAAEISRRVSLPYTRVFSLLHQLVTKRLLEETAGNPTRYRSML
jgi:oligosaccharide amylase